MDDFPLVIKTCTKNYTALVNYFLGYKSKYSSRRTGQSDIIIIMFCCTNSYRYSFFCRMQYGTGYLAKTTIYTISKIHFWI